MIDRLSDIVFYGELRSLAEVQDFLVSALYAVDGRVVDLSDDQLDLLAYVCESVRPWNGSPTEQDRRGVVADLIGAIWLAVLVEQLRRRRARPEIGWKLRSLEEKVAQLEAVFSGRLPAWPPPSEPGDSHRRHAIPGEEA